MKASSMPDLIDGFLDWRFHCSLFHVAFPIGIAEQVVDTGRRRWPNQSDASVPLVNRCQMRIAARKQIASCKQRTG